MEGRFVDAFDELMAIPRIADVCREVIIINDNGRIVNFEVQCWEYLNHDFS